MEDFIEGILYASIKNALGVLPDNSFIARVQAKKHQVAFKYKLVGIKLACKAARWTTIALQSPAMAEISFLKDTFKH